MTGIQIYKDLHSESGPPGASADAKELKQPSIEKARPSSNYSPSVSSSSSSSETLFTGFSLVNNLVELFENAANFRVPFTYLTRDNQVEVFIGWIGNGSNVNAKPAPSADFTIWKREHKFASG